MVLSLTSAESVVLLGIGTSVSQFKSCLTARQQFVSICSFRSPMVSRRAQFLDRWYSLITFFLLDIQLINMASIFTAILTTHSSTSTWSSWTVYHHPIWQTAELNLITINLRLSSLAPQLHFTSLPSKFDHPWFHHILYCWDQESLCNFNTQTVFSSSRTSPNDAPLFPSLLQRLSFTTLLHRD